MFGLEELQLQKMRNLLNLPDFPTRRLSAAGLAPFFEL
jgi:hypothetical protein